MRKTQKQGEGYPPSERAMSQDSLDEERAKYSMEEAAKAVIDKGCREDAIHIPSASGTDEAVTFAMATSQR
jgi:hypothetical protein